MAVGREFADRKQQVQRADDVVRLGEDGVLPIDHRVGSRALLGEVDDRVRRHLFHDRRQKVIVADVADKRVNVEAGHAAPGADALRQGTDGRQRLRAQLVVPLAAGEIVHD